MLAPHVVIFSNLPAVKTPAAGTAQHPGKQQGGENEQRERSQITEAEADARRAKALLQPVRAAHVQQLREVSRQQQRAASIQGGAAATDVLNVLAGFDGPDISQCCGNSASVPPDTHMAAGLNHVVATVNSAIGIYSKQGQLLNGPVVSDTFFGNANCTGTFDPTVEYDEGSNRWIINYDASPNDCIAVSQTSDPTGAWNVYSFDSGIADPNNDLFDYPHIGVGDQAIYVGANIFIGNTGFAGRVWALNKTQMYAGLPLTAPTSHDLLDGGNADGTPTPMVLHGSPGVAGTVFIVTDDPNFSGDTFGIWRWIDPTGATAPTLVGYADLATATGVNANSPIDQVQLGTAVTIQANDVRSLDAEWRNGSVWVTHQMSCNVGAGAQGCARWAQIDPSNASVTQAGVISIFGKFISFPNLAVDANDNMALGFTVMGPSKRPSVYIAARSALDPPGTLRDAVEVRRGDTIYAAFDGSPGRWGDYSGMAADPDGQHLWYLGEYSKAGLLPPYVPNSFGNWGTFIQEIGFGPQDQIFASNFDPLSASLELHAEINGEEADTAPGVGLSTGDPVQFRYVVINTGQQRLRNVVVSDDKLGVITCPVGALDAGADMVCDVNGTAISGQYTNNATVTAIAADGTHLTGLNQGNYKGFNALVGTKCSATGGVGCPEALVDNGTVTSHFTVAGCGTIDDVNVGLSIDHTYVGDLLITLKSPNNTSIRLLNSPISGNDNCRFDNVRALLDDASVNGNVDLQCRSVAPAIFGTYQPSLPLSGFNGAIGNGVWILTVQDVFPQDTGTLNDWSLQLTCH
jgi:subtilisin-like proprotein convertase family protein